MANTLASGNDALPLHLSIIQQAISDITKSSNYKKTLLHVANAMVPAMSDWCAVDIMENGRLQRVAIAHTDKAKLRIAKKLNEKYPPDPNDQAGIWEAILTGQPIVLNNITDETYKQHAKNAEHLEMLRALHFRSMLIYPLRGYGNELIGSITFVWAEHQQAYSLSDVAFAEILSTIAAGAIQYSRLRGKLIDQRKASTNMHP